MTLAHMKLFNFIEVNMEIDKILFEGSSSYNRMQVQEIFYKADKIVLLNTFELYDTNAVKFCVLLSDRYYIMRITTTIPKAYVQIWGNVPIGISSHREAEQWWEAYMKGNRINPIPLKHLSTIKFY